MMDAVRAITFAEGCFEFNTASVALVLGDQNLEAFPLGVSVVGQVGDINLAVGSRMPGAEEEFTVGAGTEGVSTIARPDELAHGFGFVLERQKRFAAVGEEFVGAAWTKSQYHGAV